MRYKTLVSQMYTSYCPQDLPKMRKKLQLESEVVIILVKEIKRCHQKLPFCAIFRLLISLHKHVSV